MALKLTVTRLAWKTTDADLRELFAEFGRVTACKIARDWETGVSRRHGTVTFAHDAHADAALSALEGAELDGAEIHVELAPGQVRSAAPAPVAAPAAASAPVAAEVSGDTDAADRAAETVRSARTEQAQQSARKGSGGEKGSPGQDESSTFG